MFISLTLQRTWVCCWQKNDEREGAESLCLIPAVVFSPVIEISCKTNPLSWVKHNVGRNQLVTRTPRPERIAPFPGWITFMKTYADKHFLTAKKNRESNREAMPETMGHPTCLSKPRIFCGTDAHPEHFTSARTCLWVSLCLCFGKTALLLQANTPSGIAHLVQPAQETHPLPYVGPHKHARSCRRSPFLPDGTWQCSSAYPHSRGSPWLV